MRMRLGILQDTAAIDKAHAKEAAEAAAKKHKLEIPTVKTEAQMKADEKAAAKAAKESTEPKPAPILRIRPLSEAKAVDTGATFISEAFLFGVAASLIFFESWRSRRKETSRHEDVADRLAELEESEKAARRALVELEREVLQLRAKNSTGTTTNSSMKRILPRDIWDVPEKDENNDDEKSKSWLSRIAAYISSRDTEKATNEPGPAEKILVQSDAALAEKHRQTLGEVAKAANERAKS
jgi:ribosomal protein L29